MGIMMLAAEPGSMITIIVDGCDEATALQALKDLISNKFYEDTR
jgi:phosphocarrier protein